MSVLHLLEQRIAGHQHLLVAYSGGLDSSVLLHQLVSLRQRRTDLHLRAIHIHHGLSQQAGHWVSHCQQQCEFWRVPLAVVYVQVDGHELGIEAAARQARYQAFSQALQPGESLVTAQHQDDQCETLLLALKRGSGPAGLAAMPETGLLGAHCHLRPLLSQTRQQLETWAANHALSWIEDDSNQDTRFDRNFLRQTVLPQLTSRWPHFTRSVSRSAALCAGQEQLLDELLAESLAELTDEQGALRWSALVDMSELRRAALLRRWIAQQNGLMPSRDALQRLWQEVACARSDADPRFVLGKYEVRRFRDRLYWLKPPASLSQHVIAWPDCRRTLILPDGMGHLTLGEEGGVSVRAAAPSQQVTVRFQARGAFHIVGRNGSRSLKKIWQERGIPPWQRERTPLIFYDQTLIAAPGVFVTREGAANTRDCWHIHWQKKTHEEAQDD